MGREKGGKDMVRGIRGVAMNVGELAPEYERLWKSAIIRPEKEPRVKALCGLIAKGEERYKFVAEVVGCPWQLIACIHNMEAGLNFKAHLHNGDPLSARTVHVPRGRPKTHAPPFTWVESAIDAVGIISGWDQWDDWTISGSLYMLERYNGWGYRKYHPSVLSPYLWSWTNHYTKGKYAADGKWDGSLVSQQCGCVAILKTLGWEG